MAVERFVSQIDEAKKEFIRDLNSQLHQLQSEQTPGQFAFDHKAGEEPKDVRLFRRLAVLRQQLSYHRPTWWLYEYTDGLLQTAKFQPVGPGDPAKEIPGSRIEIEPDGIPFENFSQKELISTGKAIQSIRPETPTPQHP